MTLAPFAFKVDYFVGGKRSSFSSEKLVLEIVGQLDLKLDKISFSLIHSVCPHSDTFALTNSLQCGEVIGENELGVTDKAKRRIASVFAVIFVSRSLDSHTVSVAYSIYYRNGVVSFGEANGKIVRE